MFVAALSPGCVVSEEKSAAIITVCSLVCEAFLPPPAASRFFSALVLSSFIVVSFKAVFFIFVLLGVY